jgi:hypothetical protein
MYIQIKGHARYDQVKCDSKQAFTKRLGSIGSGPREFPGKCHVFTDGSDAMSIVAKRGNALIESRVGLFHAFRADCG